MAKWPPSILDRVYPFEGSRGGRGLLPHRTASVIAVLAHRRALKTVVPTGGIKVFAEEAILAALIDAGWTKRRTAAALGCSLRTVYGFVYRDRDRRLAESFAPAPMREAA